MRRETSLMLALLLLAAHAPTRTTAHTRQQQTPTPTPQQQSTRPTQSTTQQQPTPQPSPATDSDEDVVRITTNLVQFDAVVTDKQGRLVTDLRPEEFEVLVDGKRQDITNLSFILAESGTAAAPRPVARPDKTAPPLPPVPLRAGQVRRTIALLVDDLGTSFESLIQVRRALRKFVDEQMQPGDFVAIMQTGRGLGALQQFTTDRELLHRAIERVRWNPVGRSGTSAFAPLEQDPLEQYGGKPSPNGSQQNDAGGDESATGLDKYREEIFTVGTLGAINFTIRGMKELPGRKSIVLFGDGLPIFDRRDLTKSSYLREKVRQLADLANRASVVIYTMDARGLPTLELTAADNVAAGPDPQRLIGAADARRAGYIDSQDGLRFLAEQTGGLFIHETNDLGGGVQRILEDQKGYYLIGFRPDVSVFERVKGSARFNHFEVKVKRAGLRVRTRAGFYGVPENEAKPVRRTRSEQILAAITSPLTSGELSLRLTSLFNSPTEKTSVVDSLMHLDMSQFKFTDEPDGWKKAVVDVVALTFGEDGQVVDELNRTETVRARGDAFDQILKHGVVYAMKVPVKKPGAYQLRVAVRDAATEKLGSASQFIEVPDLKRGRLALSGIFLTIAASAPKAGPAASAQASDGAADDANPLRNATVRRFRQGSLVEFQYHIYNARTQRPAGRPQLQTQMRVFHDGQPVFNGSLQTYDPGQQTDMSHLLAGGRLQLGTQLPPGDYVLQVVVNDALAGGKNHSAAQWIDFEIIK